MEAFLGTWKVNVDKTSGMEDLGKLFGWDDAKSKMYATLGYTLVLEAKGDGSYKANLDYGQFNIPIDGLKVGEEIEYTSPDGTKPLLTIRIENGDMLEDYRTREGITWNTIRKVDGNNMSSVTTSAQDASIKVLQYLTRV